MLHRASTSVVGWQLGSTTPTTPHYRAKADKAGAPRAAMDQNESELICAAQAPLWNAGPRARARGVGWRMGGICLPRPRFGWHASNKPPAGSDPAKGARLCEPTLGVKGRQGQTQGHAVMRAGAVPVSGWDEGRKKSSSQLRRNA